MTGDIPEDDEAKKKKNNSQSGDDDDDFVLEPQLGRVRSHTHTADEDKSREEQRRRDWEEQKRVAQDAIAEHQRFIENMQIFGYIPRHTLTDPIAQQVALEEELHRLDHSTDYSFKQERQWRERIQEERYPSHCRDKDIVPEM